MHPSPQVHQRMMSEVNCVCCQCLVCVNICVNLQERVRLEELLKTVQVKELRDFCCALLSNQIGGAGSVLRFNADGPTQRQTLLELLVHLDSVLLSGNTQLVPLYQIAFQPQNVTVRHRTHLTGVCQVISASLTLVCLSSGVQCFHRAKCRFCLRQMQ